MYRPLQKRGGRRFVPGPLIRVPAGTRLRITIRNDLAQPATVHGLHEHEGMRDSVVIAPGESRELRFVAS
jgi:FtsP/CotA-like multicopper oxidase with cupredoxin domain